MTFWDFIVGVFWFYILFTCITIFITIFVDVFRDKTMGGGAKAGWIIFLILVPFLSAFIYLIARRDSMGQRASAAAQAVHRPARLGGRVLVVDDNRDAADTLALVLEAFGYEVRTAYDSVAALAALRAFAPDAAILDIGLPGMDGYEFLREAHALPSAAEAPGFALTGYGQESDMRRARAAGYVDHFVKPFTAETIDQRIRSRLYPAHAP